MAGLDAFVAVAIMENMKRIDWAKVEPSPALAELMRQDADREADEPLGGWRGQWAVRRDDPPPPKPPEPLRIPPADWSEEERERDRVRAAEAQQALEPTRNSYPAPRGVQKRPRWPT